MRCKSLYELVRLDDAELMAYYKQLNKHIDVLSGNSLANVEPRLEDYWLTHLDTVEETMMKRGIQF
jgi:hypothetical protein